MSGITHNSVRNARWSVYYRGKGKWKRRRFQDDFPAAMRFLFEKREKDPNATLHCDNVAFPPPTSITRAEREDWEIVRRKGKKFKKKVITVYNKLDEWNHEGIWWCPYCIKLRRFKEVTTERGQEICCPVCWASNFEFGVRQANPLAINAQLKTEMRSNARTASTRKRRRR